MLTSTLRFLNKEVELRPFVVVNFRDATSKMSEIIDRLGQLSANAQKLNTPVTTAQRLRMSENQTIYLLADVNAGNK